MSKGTTSIWMHVSLLVQSLVATLGTVLGLLGLTGFVVPV